MTATMTHPEQQSAPIRPTRLPALDVLRGIAILGTLLTNIWIFSTAGDGLGLALGSADDAGAGGPLTTALETGLGLVTDGKFIGLLTIMFGIGLEIQRQSALRRGERWPGRYPWRAAILVLDGVLNYVFIFEFDVLMGYGLTALAVSAIMITSPKAQKIWMIVGLSVHVAVIAAADLLLGLLTVLMGPDGQDELGRGSGADGSADKDLLSLMTPDSTDSYWAMVHSRVENFALGRMEIPIMIMMGLGLFLVGAHLFRAGIFEARGRKLRIRTMALSFGIGLPIDWTLRLFAADWAALSTRYITSTLVAFGILALVAHFYVGRTTTGPVGACLSAVGRMALTCYIAQNLIASVLFYNWGFGLAERIDGEHQFWWTLLIYAGIAAFLISFSLVWQRFFRRGPVEWTWNLGYAGIGRLLDRRAEGRRRW